MCAPLAARVSALEAALREVRLWHLTKCGCSTADGPCVELLIVEHALDPRRLVVGGQS